jgi:NitT/TauT family transport system permease protein
MPLASALMPIPSLAWVPVFILWFGLGDAVAILIVFYAAMFPTLLNTWTGVRAVNPLWLRAADAMGAGESALFWKVIIPGASPLIIAGLRKPSCGRGLRWSAPKCWRHRTGVWAGSFSTPRSSSMRTS